MFRKALFLLTGSLLIASCGTTKVNPTVTPLKEIKRDFVVPKLKVSKGPDYVPAKFIRIYRCSYADDNGNVVKGAFIWVKIRDERVKASF